MRHNAHALRSKIGERRCEYAVGRVLHLFADRDDLTKRAERAEARLAKLEALFAGGPDTSCRTTWHDGVECVEVPTADLHNALAPEDGTNDEPPAQRLHNPWDANCSKNLPGEPTKTNARCPICSPPPLALSGPLPADDPDGAA
jgi:hypothetical protein